MPTLACRICGRVVYTATSLDSLFAEERRCPRCGGMLFAERRAGQRRRTEVREDAPDAPGPFDADAETPDERRTLKRRRDDKSAL